MKNEIKKIKADYKSAKKEVRKAYKAAVNEAEKRRMQEMSDLAASLGEKPKINPPKRSLLEEIGNSITHGVGAIFAIVASILMFIFFDRTLEYAGAAVYAFGSVVMFTMSCLYHAFRHGSAVKRLFRRFDYSSIYLLIGSTFAPVLLAFFSDTFGLVFFGVQWAIIAFGISFVGVFGPTRFRFIHIPLYVILGWSALMLMPRMINGCLPMFLYILVGGVIYSLGIIPFVLKKRVSHFIWHFFVLAGAVVQWFGIFLYLYIQ